MQTFLFQTIDTILKKHHSLEDVVLVLPSQRASVFVREECKNQISVGFLPMLFSIEEFVSDISGFEKIDTIQLLFYFYDVYKNLETDPQSFDTFSSWAVVALQDFNETDQYLINHKDLFSYVRDIKRLQKWSVQNTILETEIMKTHSDFVEKLGLFYNSFTQFLVDKKKGYQGLIFKKAIENIENYLFENSEKNYYFIGFNALSKSEEILIQTILKHKNSDVFWDIDSSFFNSKHQAGSFIRKYQQDWSFFKNNELKTLSNNFNTSKNIHVIGATKNVTQIKEVSNILNSFNHFSSTALVLGDESLLSVMLNSIPEKVDSLNITMGYSLKEMPAFQLIKDLFELYITRERLNTINGDFYYKSVLKLLNNSLLKSVFSIKENVASKMFTDYIIKNNLTFIEVNEINSFFKDYEIKNLFLKEISVAIFIDKIIEFINYAKDLVNDLEKEYLYRFYTCFVQLKNLNKEKNYCKELATLYLFFKQIIGKETLSFQGEPLSGLQCMGVLETRVLDFENVIITSMNEGVIPKNSNQNSFIPFDVKVHFGLPTYKEKDAIFSYHFFRLLQRAKNIFLLYNTENDHFGSGEKSRFISQLELLKENIQYKTVSPPIKTFKVGPKEIQKTEEITNKLKERAEKGFSPSAIGLYLYNPIDFYKQKVLGLQEIDEVEETMATNTMGSIVHKTLEILYLPFVGQYLTVEIICSLEEKTQQTVDELFPKHFKKGNYKTGKTKLIYEIIISYIKRFLNHEKEILKEGNRLKIIEVEKKIEAEFVVKGFDFPIKLYGEIDRIDEINGDIRIIDYKTGVVDSSNMKIPEDWNLNDYKHSKAIQVLIYAYMFMQKYPKKYDVVLAGNISFKRLKNGFMPVIFSEGNNNNQEITEERLKLFTESLREIINEIFDSNIPFKEKEK